MTKKLCSALGLAKRAGAVTAGTSLVIEAIRRRKAVLVLTADGVSESTEERLRNKCSFYGVPLIYAGLTMDELSSAIGILRPSSAVALTNPDFVPLIYKILNNSEKQDLSD